MDDYFSNIISLNPTFLFTKIYCLGIFIVVLVEHGRRLNFFNSSFIAVRPNMILGYPLNNISLFQFHFLWGLSLIMLFFAFLGLYPRVSLLASSATLYIYFETVRWMDDLIRKHNHVICILVSLAFLPDWEMPVHGKNYPYVMILVILILSQIYLSTAIQKFKRTGVAWMNGYTMKYFLLHHHLLYRDKFPLWLANLPIPILRFISITTLAFEATFVILLVFPKLLVFYAVLGILIHLIIELSMRIHYFRFLIWSYLGLLAVYYKFFFFDLFK